MGIPPTCLCGECLKCIRRARSQAYRARIKRQRPPKPPCPQCGEAVASTNPRAIYCCLRCARQGSTKKLNEKHRRRVQAYKSARGCAVCGLAEPTYVLDLHHLDASTKWRSFGGSLTHKWERLEVELEKCVVLCANHHRMVETGDISL